MGVTLNIRVNFIGVGGFSVVLFVHSIFIHFHEDEINFIDILTICVFRNSNRMQIGR